MRNVRQCPNSHLSNALMINSFNRRPDIPANSPRNLTPLCENLNPSPVPSRHLKIFRGVFTDTFIVAPARIPDMTDNCSRCDAFLVSDEKALFVFGEVVCSKCATEIYKQKQAAVEKDGKSESDKVGKSTLRMGSIERRYDATRRFAARLRRVAEFIVPDEWIISYVLLSVFAGFGILATRWYAGIVVFLSLAVLIPLLSMSMRVASYLLSLAVDIAEGIGAMRSTLDNISKSLPGREQPPS